MSVEPESKKTKVGTSLDQLKRFTTVVADTGDFEGESYNTWDAVRLLSKMEFLLHFSEWFD